MYMDHDNDKRDMHDRSIDRSTRKYLPSPNNLVTIQCRCPTTIRSPTRAEPSPPSEVIFCFVFVFIHNTRTLAFVLCVDVVCKYIGMCRPSKVFRYTSYRTVLYCTTVPTTYDGVSKVSLVVGETSTTREVCRVASSGSFG